MATADPLLAEQRSAETRGGLLGARLSRKIVLGGVVLLIGAAVVTAIWPSRRDKDKSASTTQESLPRVEFPAPTAAVAPPWNGTAADGSARTAGVRPQPQWPASGPAGRSTPYESAEAALSAGAATPWDDSPYAAENAAENAALYADNSGPAAAPSWTPRPRTAGAPATPYSRNPPAATSWSSGPTMPSSYNDSLDSGRPEIREPAYARSAPGMNPGGAISERWTPPEAPAGSRSQPWQEDRLGADGESRQDYRTAARPGGFGWRFGEREEKPTGRSSAGPTGTIRGIRSQDLAPSGGKVPSAYSGSIPSTAPRDYGPPRVDQGARSLPGAAGGAVPASYQDYLPPAASPGPGPADLYSSAEPRSGSAYPYPTTSYPATSYPATEVPSGYSAPRYGAEGAATAWDAGAARFDGTIQKPPIRTSYERTRPSLY